MRKVWVVVANRSQMRLYQLEKAVAAAQVERIYLFASPKPQQILQYLPPAL